MFTFSSSSLDFTRVSYFPVLSLDTASAKSSFTFLLQSSSSSTEIELTFLAISFASSSTSFLPHASPAFINSFGRWVYEALGMCLNMVKISSGVVALAANVAIAKSKVNNTFFISFCVWFNYFGTPSLCASNYRDVENNKCATSIMLFFCITTKNHIACNKKMRYRHQPIAHIIYIYITHSLPPCDNHLRLP